MHPVDSVRTLTLGSWVFLAPARRTGVYLLLIWPILLLCLTAALMLSPSGFEGGKNAGGIGWRR